MLRMLGTARYDRTRATLAGCVASLALCALAMAGNPTAAGASTSAPTAGAAAAADERRIALWNHDMELGTDGAAPRDWTANPTKPSGTRKAVRTSAPSVFPRYTAEKSVNHVVWVYDKTKGGGTTVGARALDAAPGRRYTVYAQVYVGSGTGARLSLEFRRATGARVALVDQASRTPAAGKLTWVKATGVAPAGTTSVRPLVVSSYAAVGSSYWDLFYMDEFPPAAAAYASRLGTGPVLFVGGHRVEATTGLTRVVHPGQKYRAPGEFRDATPVYDAVCCIKDGQPGHSSQLFGTVLYEDGRYRMWYTAKAAGLPWSVRYTESSTGRSFPRGVPVLSGVWAAGVVRNPSTANPSRKYLMLGIKGTMPPIAKAPMPPIDVTYRAYASPDGLTWTPLSAAPVLPMRDVASVSYDDATGRFVATTKQASGSDRRVYVSYSTDFLRWTTPRQALRADTTDPAGSSMYGAAVFRYGDQLLGVPQLYTKATVGGVKGPIVPQIASSTDGLTWSRPARAPLVPLGESGELDDGIILTANTPVVVGDRIRLYYGGWDGGHEETSRNARIFYAEWVRDRFVSLRATSGSGTLTTKALRPTGDGLTVNANLGSGQLRASVLDAGTNAVVAGYGSADSTVVTGDVLGAPLTWGGKTIGDLGDRQIKLRFTLTSGDLFAFRIS